MKRVEGKDFPNYSGYAEEIKEPLKNVKSNIFFGIKSKFSAQFYIRMLFSCLVDADFLDTENLIHLPSSFNNKQINSFMNSSFNNFFNLMNQYLMGEVSTLQEEIFNEKDINTNDYFKYRFLLLQKTLNISHTTTLVPFIDLIKHEFNKSNINCKLIVNKGHIKIKAIKNINRNEVLTIKQRKITNQYSFYFYGKTYDELIDYMPSFIVPIVIPNILIDEGIELDINEDEEENKVDLAWDKFYDVVLPSYKELMRQIQKEDSNINCYK